MTHIKPWYQSRTIWASVVAIGAAASGALGLPLNETAQVHLVDAVIQLVAVGASLTAIFGRLAATSIIE